MSKNPFLFVFSAFLFVSAALGVPSAYAADSGDGLQFCFYEDKEGNLNYPRLNFSQKTENDSRKATEVCFDKWYEANPTGNGTPDANTYLNNWLSQNDDDIVFVRVMSDIKFAGRSSIGCAVGNNAFEGKMITLYSFQTLYSQINPQTNEPYVISGLCHFGNVQIVAFIEKFSGTMYNMNFDDAYLNASATNSSAGIIAEGVTGLDGSRVFNGYIHDVKVTNSEFQGTNVGAIVGKGNTDISSAELHNVKIVGNSNTNSYVGGIIGDNTVRCLHADQGNVHPCSNAKNNGKSAGPFVLENVDLYGSTVTGPQSHVGGIAGSIVLNVQQEYHDISIKGLRLNGSTYAGGMFGQVFYDGSDDASLGSAAVEHKLLIHDVSIEHGSFPIVGGSGDENGFIKAGLRAGGLIGYCDVGNNANNTDGADIEIYNVDNKIEVRIDDANNISAGGIIGNLMNSSNETTNLSIYNTNTEGDVIGGSDCYKMGYLVGEMVTSKINLKQITDNTHYGDNDYVAAKGIGSIDPANWLNPPAPINATGTGLVVKRNFRNEVNGESAQTSLVADGSLKNGNDGYYIEDVTTSDKYANGVLATAALNQYQNNTGSSEEYLFCVKIPTNKDSLYLKQISGSETAPDGYTCYDYWYNTSSQHDQIAAEIFDDASSRIQYWLDSRNDKKTAHVVVESDLHFAGRNVDGTCKTAKNEFNQLLTFSRHYQSNYSYTKGDYTIQGVGVSDDDYRVISGLCYVTEYDSSAGFFRRFEGDMSKLAFDNAYFKTSWSNNTKSGTGIIASGFGSASIKVTNSEFHGIAAGAVFGRGGGELTNVVVEGVKVYGKNYAGGLIGYWDYTFKQNVQIELAKVEADVDVSGISPIYAGALIGYLGNYGSTNVSIKVANTYSKGNVTGTSGATLGYLIGAFNQHDIFEFDIQNNYHYGTDDESVKLGIGTFTEAEWLNPSTSATSTIKNGVILRNFRNAVGSLEVDGDLRYALKPIFKSATESYFNGVISSEQMISFRMAAVLNMDAASEKWTMVNDENDHMPIFVGGSNAASNPVYAISFDYETFNTSADESSKKILSDAIADGKRTLEYIPQYPDGGIVLFTDAEGFLNDDDIAFVKSLMNENGFWYNSSYPKLDANQSYTSSETYTYKKALVMNVAVHVCSGNGNSGCIDGSEVLVPKEGATWNGYSIDFNGVPMTEYTFNYMGGGYPTLVMSDFSSHLYMFYSPDFYHINSKNAMQSSIHKAVLYNFEELLDGLTANEKNDLESGTVYNDTIHLYYVFGNTAPEYKFPVENKGTSPVVVKSFLENANGMGRKQVYETVIDANETVNVPLMRTTVAPTDLGYSLEWNAEFGLGSVFSGTHDVISTENDYITSAEDFYNNSYTKSWMVTGASGKPLTVNDSVYMDSIVTAISTTSLANHLSYNDLKMVITPTVTQLHYDLVFAIPEDMRDADIYVSNKKNKSTNKLELDWFDKLDDVTAENVKAPKLLNSDGCLINWKLEGSSSTHAALDIQHELQYLTSKEENSLAVNTLVPDIDNPACPSANVTVDKHTIQLNRDGDGDLFAVQKLPYPSATTQGAIDTIVLKHSFKKDANDKYYLDVPVARDADGSELGIKLSFIAEPEEGSVLNELSYEVAQDGMTVPVYLSNGSVLDIKASLPLTVKYLELVPVYVTYNLSLTSAADSAKTYLPADASSTATLEMVKADDEIEFWSPYRTDVCFAGWSNVKAESFTDADPLWVSLNSSNYIDFSNNQDHPTALYAIWRECPVILPIRATALKSGLEHATLVVYQPFGKDSLRHVITDEIVALAGPDFDFYVDDVRTKADAGYSLDYTSFKVSYVDPTTSESVKVTPSEGAWRLKPETLPQTTVYSFTAKVTKDEYKLVFNDNSSGEAYFGDSWTPLMTKESFAEDENTKNWNVSVNYNVESADTKFPLALYRKGLCMSGYTFDVDDNTNGLYTELDEPFIDKLKELGKDLKKPVKLYAYWSQCQTLGVEVELADSDKGFYTFTRKFDLGEGEETRNRSYSFDSDKMFVPSSKGDISFTGVTFTIKSGAGVVLDATAGISYRKGSEWNDWTSSLLTVKSDIEAIGLSLLKSSYEFVYDMNAPEDAMVFVNPSIKKRESYTLNLSTESEDLQSLEVLGRTDACLVGWALDAKGENVIKAFNIETLRTLEALEKASKPVGTLYAVWKEKGDACAPKTFKVATNWSAEEGVFTISYKYENKTYKFDVTEDGVEIPAVAGVEVGVSFAGSNAYQFDDVIKGLDIAGNLLFSIDNGHSFTVSDAQSDVKLSTGAIPTEFAFEFNANAGDANVFAGTEFAQQVPGMFYAYNQDLPMDLYRADAELVGWSFKSDVGENDFVWQTINDRFIEEYEKFVMQYGASFGTDTLYAVWKKKSMKTYTVTADSANKGTLTFTQNVGDKVFTIVVPKTGLKVPATDDIEVTAHFDVINSWSLDEGLPLVWTNAKGKKESTANDVTRKITGDVKVTALATFKEIHLVFDIPSDNGLFYGDDWSKQGDFDSDDGKLSFPTLVYDTDRCLAGWSIKSESGSAWTDLNERLVDSLYKVYPTMNDLSNIKLYARWTTNADECAGNITKATVELEHGDVQLVEKKDKSTLVHKFNNKGTMMLPAELDGKNWTLKAIPDSSYTLDSLVVMNGKKVVAVLKDGDKLPKNMENATLKAYFGKANKTPVEIVNKHFSQSGNTICVNIKASEFEVTRGVSAKVEIIDLVKDAVVVDTLLTDSAAMAFSDEITLRMLQPGKYKVRVVIGDDKESDEYSQEFTVDSQVASLKADRWQMVSLTAVDTSLIQWDEGVSFYWWDESRVGDFWQYHAFKQGDEIDASRGVWVSSKHEGYLVMRKDFEDDGKDIVWNLDSVTTGWNLIANPHGWYVDLFSMNESTRKDVDEESEISFWQYNSETGEYKETRYLAPYEAAWVKVSKKMKWKVSAEPVYVIHSIDASKIDTVRLDYQKPDGNANNSGKSNAKSALAKASTANRWTLQAVLSDKNGKRDSWNILGVGNKPFVADEPPTSMGDHVNLSIVEGSRSLAKSIKSASDETEWTLELSASDAREGYLTLEGIDGVESLGYHVYVTIDGVTTEMHEGKPLQVSLNSSSKKATVRVARSARVVAKNVIKGLRSSQVGNQLHVSFDAPESLAGERTKVELLDVKGKLWATESAKAVFGTNAVSMKLPKQGVYILRVRVGSQQQAQRILVK